MATEYEWAIWMRKVGLDIFESPEPRQLIRDKFNDEMQALDIFKKIPHPPDRSSNQWWREILFIRDYRWALQPIQAAMFEHIKWAHIAEYRYEPANEPEIRAYMLKFGLDLEECQASSSWCELFDDGARCASCPLVKRGDGCHERASIYYWNDYRISPSYRRRCAEKIARYALDEFYSLGGTEEGLEGFKDRANQIAPIIDYEV